MQRLVLVISLFLLTAGSARAQPAPVWDARGWVKLGERVVNGSYDHDTITVGAYDGKFSKLTMVVTDSDLELIAFKITFGDGSIYEPKLSHYFKEGARTRVLELPPSEKIIRSVDIRYSNLPGTGRAHVEVWGWKVGDVAPPAPPAPPPPAWDSSGWTLLGERTVQGNYDHDTIAVGKYEGKFTKLTLVVADSDLELIDLSVKFLRGAPWHPQVSHYFREGQRTRTIDFPGDERTIKQVDLRYRNLPGGGRARVQVWGLAAPVEHPVWDNKGWTLLGERTVDGSVDHDRIAVGRNEGKFKRAMIVVLDSDLEMIDFSIGFGKGAPYHPELKAFFRESTRTRALDLPGDRRVIKYIDFTYRNLPGGGRARVQVWAK